MLREKTWTESSDWTAKQCLHETRTSLTGREQTGGGAEGEAGGVIVSSSLASAANCPDECRAVAASQRMNCKQCLCERVRGACSIVHVFGGET